MEPAIAGHEAVDHNELLVHTWRVARLTRLGILCRPNTRLSG
jgi:hypothetical protein